MIVIIVITVIITVICILILTKSKKNLLKTSSTQLDLPLLPIPQSIPYNSNTDYKICWVNNNTYWLVHPIKDDKFTIEIYDLDLNKIKTLYDNTVRERGLDNVIYFLGIFDNEKFSGMIYRNKLTLIFNIGTLNGFTAPKMVKAIDIKEFTNTGDKINLYGFSNTQKIELECTGNNVKEERSDDNQYFYNAKLYDHDKIIKSGSGRIYRDAMLFVVEFEDTYFRGHVTPLYLNRTIGIYTDELDGIIYYFAH